MQISSTLKFSKKSYVRLFNRCRYISNEVSCSNMRNEGLIMYFIETMGRSPRSPPRDAPTSNSKNLDRLTASVNQDLLAIFNLMDKTQPERSSQGCIARDLEDFIRICHLNIQAISRPKYKILTQLLKENNIDLVLIQESHLYDEKQAHSRAYISGYEIIGIRYY